MEGTVMTTPLRCPRCDNLNPAEARFCIECGATLVEAATGATTKLAGRPCPHCRTLNPEDAHFCVTCGRSFAAPPRPSTGSGRAHQRAPHARPASGRHCFARVATPPSATMVRHGKPNTGALMIFGIAFLLITGTFWPGILLLIGVVTYVNAWAAGHAARGLKPLLWLGGLTLLFATHTLWPGILLLIAVSWLLDR